ncbi:MAG: cysteine desulfurase family protein [Acidobacteriota bacterium]|nr:cysteine desulfurase [Blastocatellia bacterium]MDW8412597.1 cysteine desulfurase family protein [Acidobacteriota bacterium]
MTRRIYFDNSATTFVLPEVAEAMQPYLTEFYGNPSSVHSFGQKARAAVEDARRKLALSIGADPSEIVFLSGGTEANNLAIRGIAQAQADKGRHIITCQFEHPAVLNTCAALEKQGWRVTYLPVYKDGLVRVEDLLEAITDETVLITIMHANNEVGTVQCIEEIGKVVREIRLQRRNIFFHSDAVQTFGKLPINVKQLGVDLLSISGHKIHAPKGIGALFVRKGVRLVTQSTGGHQERDRRAGTENVPGIVALARAAELAVANLDAFAHIRYLRDYLEDEISRLIPDVLLNGHRERRLPNISNITFKHVDGEGLLISLDLKGIAVSTGAACSSGSTEQSHVLAAMGLDKELIRGSLRFSFSRFNTLDEVNYLIQVLPEIVERLRKLSPRWSHAR